MRLLLHLFISVLLTLAIAWFLWRDTLKVPTPPPAPPTARQRQFGMAISPALAEILERRLPSPCVYDGPLNDGLAHLVHLISPNTRIVWRASNPRLVNRKISVSADVSGFLLGDALLKLLDDSNHDPPLAATAEEDDFSFSTVRDKVGTVKFGTFDIRDLVVVGIPKATDAADLVRRITATVDPPSWGGESLDGPLRPPNVFGPDLHVRQSDLNLREIERLLHQIRQEQRAHAFWQRTLELLASVLFAVLFLHALYRLYRLRRCPRWAFTATAAASLFLSIAIIPLWFRSHRVGDSLYIRTPGRWFYIVAAEGNLRVGGWLRAEHNLPTIRTPFSHKTINLTSIRRSEESTWRRSTTRLSVAFISYSSGTVERPNFQSRWTLTIPFPLFFSLFLFAPLVWTLLFFRREALYAAGLCPSCGYDLRATPERCPECGHVPSAAIVKATA